jgi:hypothetical protein
MLSWLTKLPKTEIIPCSGLLLPVGILRLSDDSGKTADFAKSVALSLNCVSLMEFNMNEDW